ncbi:MAG: hypothetical protein ACJAWO_000335 [Halieaceae bacterium]|jgi:hypothetical protein
MNNVYNDPAYKDDIKILKVRLLQLKKQYTDDKYPEMKEVIEDNW